MTILYPKPEPNRPKPRKAIPRKRGGGARQGRMKPADMKGLRMERFELDNWKCQKCFCDVFDVDQRRNESAHLSHKQAKRRGGDSLQNTETLCGSCHRTLHQWGPSMKKPCAAKIQKGDNARA